MGKIHDHHTVIGHIGYQLLLAIGLAHKDGVPVTLQDGKTFIDAIPAMAKIVSEIAEETKGFFDPADRVKAICKGILAHESEIPEGLRAFIAQYLNGYLMEISGLPLKEIEAVVTATFKK